ncbi:hypothetical protein FOZ63_021855, partial [Perkinsus olseni]
MALGKSSGYPSMPMMKLSAYLLGCLTISQLTNGVVLQQETGSSNFLGTQRDLDQGNEVLSAVGIMPAFVYPPNQPYGPVRRDGTCPTIDGVKQYPATYWKDHNCTVCMPYLPCPAVPTKYKPKRDGS